MTVSGRQRTKVILLDTQKAEECDIPWIEMTGNTSHSAFDGAGSTLWSTYALLSLEGKTFYGIIDWFCLQKPIKKVGLRHSKNVSIVFCIDISGGSTPMSFPDTTRSLQTSNRDMMLLPDVHILYSRRWSRFAHKRWRALSLQFLAAMEISSGSD